MNIVINWASIGSEADFYQQVLSQLQAPAWHGRNLDALSDSICTGGINSVESPYQISVVGAEKIRPHLRSFSQRVEALLRNAASERRGVEVRFGVVQQAVQGDGPASGGPAP